MKDYYQSSHLASLYLDRNVLLEQILHLQNQIVTCDSKLIGLAVSNRLNSEQETAQTLQDEIFGCRIEIQSLRIRIRRLEAQIALLKAASDEQTSPTQKFKEED
jgi:hypothetical protein